MVVEVRRLGDQPCGVRQDAHPLPRRHVVALCPHSLCQVGANRQTIGLQHKLRQGCRRGDLIRLRVPIEGFALARGRLRITRLLGEYPLTLLKVAKVRPVADKPLVGREKCLQHLRVVIDHRPHKRV